MDYFLWAQTFGFIALCGEMIRFQIKDPKKIFYAEPILSISYFTQFLLLGATSAYAVSIISILRAFAGISLNKKHLRYAVLYVFIPLFLSTIFIAKPNSIVDLFPLCAILCSTLAFLHQQNRKLVTRLYLFNCAFWFFYALTVGAYVQILNCSLVALSITVGIMRHEKSISSALKPSGA